MALVLAEIEDGDDVGMMDLRGKAGFLLEASLYVGQCIGLGPEDLHRDGAFERQVEGIEDPGHATLAEHTVEAVATTDHDRSRERLHGTCLPALDVSQRSRADPKKNSWSETGRLVVSRSTRPSADPCRACNGRRMARPLFCG